MEIGLVDNYPLEFEFKGNLSRANITASQLYLHSADSPPRYLGIPIKLPDGRFVRVNGWLESDPPQPDKIEMVKNYL